MQWIQTVLSLAGVIGLILFLFYMLRRVNKFAAAASGSKLRILDRAVTGRDSSLLVISVSGKLMLIGVSTGKIEKLCDLDISEEEYNSSEENADKPVIKFSDVLKNAFFFKNKETENMPVNTPDSPKTEGEETNVETD